MFYAIVSNDKHTRVMNLDVANRFEAENEAYARAKEEGVFVEAIHKVDNTGKQNGTITKFAKYRKKYGKQHKNFDKSL